MEMDDNTGKLWQSESTRWFHGSEESDLMSTKYFKRAVGDEAAM